LPKAAEPLTPRAADPLPEDEPSTDRVEHVTRHVPAGTPFAPADRAIPVEAPVAIEFNGIAVAVMMATPADLEDFVAGFAAAERLLAPGELPADVDVHHADHGILLRARLPAAGADEIFRRTRTRVAESSCGLCGIESLAEIARPLPRIVRPLPLGDEALFHALAGLKAHQPLAGRTAAVHAAALCRPDGTIALAREDVGRHNALDKAIGGRLRQGLTGDLFALSTARCSYELVEKAALAGLGALVTISAPTTLAVDRARAAGLPLFALARPDAVLRFA
jgi:FdhD protein